MKTVMLMGDHHTRELNDFVDYIIKVPSKDTPRIQEAHIFVGHLLAEYVEEEIFKRKQMNNFQSLEERRRQRNIETERERKYGF